MKEEFVGSAEEESRVVLWTNSAARCGIVGVGMVLKGAKGSLAVTSK